MFKKIPVFIIIFILSELNLFADFGPKNSNVKTGDARYNDSIKIKKYTAKKSKSFYSGQQGGAYIMLRFFQIVISPQNGPSCRYHPTCSHYGKDAVRKHGSLMGSFLAGDRILRCNPYNRPGNDPVPDYVFFKQAKK